MHVELALFDGDTLLDRCVIRVGQMLVVDTFPRFQVAHRLREDTADVVLSDFASPITLTKVTLDMPIHESSDWESIKLGVEEYVIAFRCRLDT